MAVERSTPHPWRIYARDDLREVELEVLERHAVLRGFGAELADEGAVVEQRLGGDAAPVQAGAAEVFFFDAEDFLLELPGADGSGVTRGAVGNNIATPAGVMSAPLTRRWKLSPPCRAGSRLPE